MPKGGRHGNLSMRASRIYEAIRRENPGYSKKKAAKIANASVAGTIDHKGGRKKGKKR